jgi:DNA-binding transcriptional MocR family regulator
MFLWLKLLAGVADADDILHKLIDYKVVVVPGVPNKESLID